MLDTPSALLNSSTEHDLDLLINSTSPSNLTSVLNVYSSSTSTPFISYPTSDRGPTESANNWQVFFLLVVEAAGILGNLLVCVSVVIEKKLQTITNYILVSLAIADLFVSLIVMPGYIAQEFRGYWPFGLVLCTIWQMADVTMCTSSIMHMCIISLDRYKCIRDPMSIRSRSKFSVVLRIATVWVFAVLISTPLAFLAIFRPSEILNVRSECIIANPNFLVYGSIAAFFLPLIVMLITYSLTINLLRQKAAKIERSGGLRRSVSSCRKRSPQRIHPPIRSSISLNCEDRHRHSWQPYRSVSTDERSTSNGRNRNGDQITSLNTSSTCDSTTSEHHRPTVNGGKKLAGSDSFSTTKLKHTDGKKVTNCSCWKMVRLDANDSAEKMKKKLSNVNEEIEIHYSQEYDQQNIGTSNTPLLPASSKIQLNAHASSDLPSDRRLSISTGDLRSVATSSLYNLPDKIHISSQMKVRYYHLHNAGSQKLTDRSSESNTLQLRNSPVNVDNNHAVKEILNAKRRIPQLVRESYSMDDYKSPENNSSSEGFAVTSRNESEYIEHVTTPNLPPSLDRSLASPAAVDTPTGQHRFIRNVSTNRSKPGKNQCTANQPHKFSKVSNRSKACLRNQNISKAVTNERKAVKVLGLMFLMFVACWAVFFCVNFAMGVCPECKFNEYFFKYVLWLGYTSSLINPIIYTVFNLSFRKAFVRILTCQYCRFQSRKAKKPVK